MERISAAFALRNRCQCGRKSHTLHQLDAYFEGSREHGIPGGSLHVGHSTNNAFGIFPRSRVAEFLARPDMYRPRLHSRIEDLFPLHSKNAVLCFSNHPANSRFVFHPNCLSNFNELSQNCCPVHGPFPQHSLREFDSRSQSAISQGALQ